MADQVKEVVGQPELVEYFAILRKAVPIEVLTPSFEQRVFDQVPMLRLGRKPERAEAAVPGDERRDPLRGERIEVMGVSARGEKIHVRVGIDETRCDDLAGTVDGGPRFVGKVADGRDTCAF